MEEVSAWTCPRCGRAELVARHCKRICEQCGYVESCEDNFLPLQDNPRPEDAAAGVDRTAPQTN